MPENNPFVVGQPVSGSQFIGRERELNTAIDQIRQRSNLAISGSPGMGKSSILEQLALPKMRKDNDYDTSKAIVILFNCRSLTPFTPHKFWQEILDLSSVELNNEPQLQNYVNDLLKRKQLEWDCIRKFLRRLREKNKFLLLLVDEYDAALQPNQGYKNEDIEKFLYDCRSLANGCNEKKYISMLVTSFRPLTEVNPNLKAKHSPFFNHYYFIYLKPFTEEKVALLLSCIPTTAELNNVIRKVASGNPALIQIAGFLLYQELRETIPDVITFTRKFQDRTQHFFQDTWTMCNEEEQMLLMLIAITALEGRLNDKRYHLNGIPTLFKDKEKVLMLLEKRGIIIQKKEREKLNYCFSSSVMEWWVVQSIGKVNEDELYKREQIFLSLGREKAEKIANVIKYLWRNKEVVPTLLEYIGKITTAFPKGLIK